MTCEHFDKNRFALRQFPDPGKRKVDVFESAERDVVHLPVARLKCDRIIHPAFDGVARTFLGGFRDKTVLRSGRDPCRIDSLLAEELAQFGVGEGEIQKIRMTVGLIFLCNAGTDENCPDIFTESVTQETAVSDQRGSHRRDPARKFRQVFADEVHGGGTGGREQQSGGPPIQFPRDFSRNQLRAERRFADACNPQFLQCADQLCGGDASELADP